MFESLTLQGQAGIFVTGSDIGPHVTWVVSLEIADGNLSFLLEAKCHYQSDSNLTLTVLVTTTDAQWDGMGDVGSARYEPALLPPCPTIRVLSYSN